MLKIIGVFIALIVLEILLASMDAFEWARNISIAVGLVGVAAIVILQGKKGES